MASPKSQDAFHLCVNLRTRANYVPGIQHSNADYNPSDYTPCFCLKTLHVIGPDDRPVAPEDCSSRRSCFESLVTAVA